MPGVACLHSYLSSNWLYACSFVWPITLAQNCMLSRCWFAFACVNRTATSDRHRPDNKTIIANAVYSSDPTHHHSHARRVTQRMHMAEEPSLPKVTHVVSTNATGDTMLYVVPEADSRQVVLP